MRDLEGRFLGDIRQLCEEGAGLVVGVLLKFVLDVAHRMGLAGSPVPVEHELRRVGRPEAPCQTRPELRIELRSSEENAPVGLVVDEEVGVPVAETKPVLHRVHAAPPIDLSWR